MYACHYLKLNIFENKVVVSSNISLSTDTGQMRIQKEPWQTYEMEGLAKIVNSKKPLTIFAKCSNLDV